MIVIDNAAAESEIRGTVSAEFLHFRVENTRKDQNGDLTVLYLFCKLVGEAFARIGEARVHLQGYALAHGNDLNIIKSGVEEDLAATLLPNLIYDSLEFRALVGQIVRTSAGKHLRAIGRQ